MLSEQDIEEITLLRLRDRFAGTEYVVTEFLHVAFDGVEDDDRRPTLDRFIEFAEGYCKHAWLVDHFLEEMGCQDMWDVNRLVLAIREKEDPLSREEIKEVFSPYQMHSTYQDYFSRYEDYRNVVDFIGDDVVFEDNDCTAYATAAEA